MGELTVVVRVCVVCVSRLARKCSKREIFFSAACSSLAPKICTFQQLIIFATSPWLITECNGLHCREQSSPFLSLYLLLAFISLVWQEMNTVQSESKQLPCFNRSPHSVKASYRHYIKARGIPRAGALILPKSRHIVFK
jgi:hypothetical protein